MRGAAMVRCPGTVPAGWSPEEMRSAHTCTQTFAALAGAPARLPTDRPIDGVDALELVQEREHRSGGHRVLRGVGHRGLGGW